MAIHIRRREFLVTLGGAAAIACPRVAHAQTAIAVIGLLDAGSAGNRAHALESFRAGLGSAGYLEGRNVALEFRYADGEFDRLPELARDLVQRQVTLIAAFGNAASRAAIAATKTIPIVFASSADPVAVGLVSSMTSPGWNVTGVTILNQELEGIRLERLVEVVPHAATIGVLINPASVTADPKLRALQTAAQLLDRRLQLFHARTSRDFAAVFANAEQQRLGAMVVVSDTVFSNESADLGRAAADHQVPSMGAYRPFAQAGGLMSYGSELGAAYRAVGATAARILKGEKPADTPVQESTKVEFIINLKSAQKLGVQIPQHLRAIANEIIE
jgi:putative tryptophan/tyrosine transport system substrate-binding protein